MANSLIAPVRLGVCRPAAPFSYLISGEQSSSDEPTIGEELFDVEPLPRRPSTPSSITGATGTGRNQVMRHRLDSESMIDRQVEQLEVADPQPSGDVGELHDIEVCLERSVQEPRGYAEIFLWGHCIRSCQNTLLDGGKNPSSSRVNSLFYLSRDQWDYFDLLLLSFA